MCEREGVWSGGVVRGVMTIYLAGELTSILNTRGLSVRRATIRSGLGVETERESCDGLLADHTSSTHILPGRMPKAL